MFITKHKTWFIGFSTLLVLVSLIVIGVRGLDYGIEFTGGSVLEVSYEERPEVADLRDALAEAGFEDALVQPFGDNGYVIKTKPLSEDERKTLVAATSIGEATSNTERFNSIGPSVGRELRTKSLYALIAVSIGIVLFVAYAFRKVSKPVSSWTYGIVAVLALIHDIIIPVGILTLMGTEIDTLYVVGLLSILGLSVNDTIVVFDRIRENLADDGGATNREAFTSTVGNAIHDTMTRSIFTSLTLVVVLLALYFAGPVATRTLSLVLLLGTIVGTYSSIFLASPLLTVLVKKKVTK
ncbi:protein translocase subunit SecF [Patescibacteria group bacterium]|nr:protein translocase subunit SecF [Patescibacteria group bacterium]